MKTSCGGEIELRKDPNIFSESATMGERETFYHNEECQPDGLIELGTTITNKTLLMAGVTQVKPTRTISERENEVSPLLQEYLEKVDPSGVAVTFIAAEKALKRAEITIGSLSAARDNSG